MESRGKVLIFIVVGIAALAKKVASLFKNKSVARPFNPPAHPQENPPVPPRRDLPPDK